MMPHTGLVYYCDHCSATFEDPADCARHEAGHRASGVSFMDQPSVPMCTVCGERPVVVGPGGITGETCRECYRPVLTPSTAIPQPAQTRHRPPAATKKAKGPASASAGLSNEFYNALMNYIDALQKQGAEQYERDAKSSTNEAVFRTNIKPKTYSVARLRKYVRIVEHTGGSYSGSAFAFLDPATGHIYKPASWTTPAKGARGSIYNLGPALLHRGGLYRR